MRCALRPELGEHATRHRIEGELNESLAAAGGERAASGIWRSVVFAGHGPYNPNAVVHTPNVVVEVLPALGKLVG
jgi:hypothetical protein